MPLEKIIRKRTLADGFMANDRLKLTAAALSCFYGANALLIGAAMIYLTIAGPGSASPLPRLISAIGFPLLLNLLLSAVGAAMLTGFIAGMLWLSAHLRLPVVSLLTALLSVVTHLCNLFIFALLAGAWFFAAINRSGKGLDLEYILRAMGLNGSKDTAAIIILVVCGIELLVWISLLLPAVSRSFKALVSAMRQIPGPYSYSYASTMMSSSQSGNEVAFLENTLKGRGSFAFRYDDELEAIYDSNRYLVRFLHRNGKVLAASLHHRSNRELMAIFPGKENAALNTEVLLEDSYQIQKARRSVARATLQKDQLVENTAEEFGWTVTTDGDGLLQLERS